MLHANKLSLCDFGEKNIRIWPLKFDPWEVKFQTVGLKLKFYLLYITSGGLNQFWFKNMRKKWENTPSKKILTLCDLVLTLSKKHNVENLEFLPLMMSKIN